MMPPRLITPGQPSVDMNCGPTWKRMAHDAAE
jgi:hypothetical protein